eukprot:gnl/TRDRNA2_/TRDRNA2_35760_c0_seq1.p1 gnl/TRDRNA2_/TRDRNA2_35760_c0~~gnl/TRDRNA2_/TRDRNA2_35760_c0_seq1.p1  ORF type:complete len:616 (+),score=76.79 gnl/TRDRNA2_/TRDRNA2_35760_c0_seq1:104-1849(+)
MAAWLISLFFSLSLHHFSGSNALVSPVGSSCGRTQNGGQSEVAAVQQLSADVLRRHAAKPVLPTSGEPSWLDAWRSWPRASQPVKELNEEEIWQQTRHLYMPFAPERRPRGVDELLEAPPGRKPLALGAEEKAKALGEWTHELCGWTFIAGLNETDSMHMAQRLTKVVFGEDDFASLVDFAVNHDQKSVTATLDEITQTWVYSGNHFGCSHKSQTFRFPGMEQYEFTVTELNSMTDGTATAAIDQLEEQSAHGSSQKNDVLEATQQPKTIREHIQTFIDVVSENQDTHAVLVSYQGELYEKYNTAHGISASTRLHGWSVTKSLNSLLLGARHAEGKLNIDQYIQAPEVELSEKKSRNMTIDNLLKMRIGSPMEERIADFMWCCFADTASFAVHASNSTPAKPHYQYSSASSEINSRELRYSFPAGPEGHKEYAAYPWKALFSKIGASSFVCEGDPKGNLILSAMCWATAHDWLKIGKLVMQTGNWNGEQVIPSEWILKTTAVIDDEASHYARGWYRVDQWDPHLDTPIIMAIGWMEQFIMIVPELELVVVRLGQLDLHIVPKVLKYWFGPTGLFKDKVARH